MIGKNTQTLKDAIKTKTKVAFNYSDKPRIVEVHAVGLTPKNAFAMRGFQTNAEDGGSWKMFTVEKIEGEVWALNDASTAPRPGYKMGDSAMAIILAQVQL